ncbi:MAG: gamma-glutamyl-gamma-aminobutyrate hydrolase family protein [Waddliaceae bacterium]
MLNIKEAILNLDYKHQEILFKKLNSRERYKVLRCIKTEQEISETEKTHKVLIKKIKEAEESPINISMTKDNSAIALLSRKIKNLVDKIAYFLGFLTARKTQQLANSYLRTSKTPTDKIKNVVSKNKLRKILIQERRANPQGHINLSEVLIKHGFSPKISGCTFNKAKIFLRVDLKNIAFENCNFESSHLSHCSLSKVTFENCTFSNTSFLSASFDHCTFHRCNLQEVMFTDAKIDHSNFSACSIIAGSFEDASITNTTFSNSALPATHFLEAFVKDSSFIKCSLKDTVFFDAFEKFSVDEKSKETAKVTRPTSAILVDPEKRGITTPKAFMKLDRAANTIPLRITLKPQKASSEQVNEEVKTTLEEIGAYNREEMPIPQKLIKNIADNPETHAESIKILKKAEKLATIVDSFFLPGGEDVPPALYGQKEDENTKWGDDYRRSILELGIIHQSFNKGIPLMAVCRGFQMSNVYFGSQLLQDVAGHKGIQKFKLDSNKHRGLYYNAVRGSILSAFFHHQAVSKFSGPTEHLEPSITYQNLIKASELEYSASTPMMLLQFHPEFYKAKTAVSMIRRWIDTILSAVMSKSNEVFWEILSDSAKAYRIKKLHYHI